MRQSVTRGRRRKSATRRAQAKAAYVLVFPYALMLTLFGIVPGFYAIYLSFVKPNGGFALFENYVTAAQDYRYAATFLHSGLYALVFLVPSLLIAILLSLLLLARRAKTVTGFQAVYYLPHSLVGAAGVVVWLFMLTPAVSPIGAVERALGYDNLIQLVSKVSIAGILAIIALWTSGNTILLMYGALASVPKEHLEASRIDGANSFQQARFVILPAVRKWIAYTTILNAAGCAELFAEPQLIRSASGLGNNWSPLQLAYTFAYQYQNYSVAAAISVQVLVIGLIAAAIVIKWVGLFKLES